VNGTRRSLWRIVFFSRWDVHEYAAEGTFEEAIARVDEWECEVPGHVYHVSISEIRRIAKSQRTARKGTIR
jgi:hypothetical protein